MIFGAGVRPTLRIKSTIDANEEILPLSPRHPGAKFLQKSHAYSRPMPVIKTGRELGAAVAKLKELFELLESGTPGPSCLVRLPDGRSCPRSPIRSHSIQRQILHRLGKGGFVKTFPTQWSAILHRLITQDGKHLVALFQKGDWPIDEIAVSKSATRRFACDHHDNLTFGPIERSDEDLTHPLHSRVLTAEHYFLLCYRISLMETEAHNEIERLWPETPPPVKEDRNFSGEAGRIMRSGEELERINRLLSDSYHGGQIQRVIATPIDVEISLPTQVAMANTFDITWESRIGEVYLTMFPTDMPADSCKGYTHRLIVSQLRDAGDSAHRTLSTIRPLIEAIREDSAGSEAFLLQVVARSMNVYFSFDYERHLPSGLRGRLARRFGEDTRAGIEALIPDLAPRKVTRSRRRRKKRKKRKIASA